MLPSSFLSIFSNTAKVCIRPVGIKREAARSRRGRPGRGGRLLLYHTSVSNRMNEVMKVLTIISTLFIPLSFLAGV